MRRFKTLVLTSCTGEKRYKTVNQLVLEDFRDSRRLLDREKELAPFRLPAGQMYTGAQHRCVMEGITLLHSKFGPDVFDLHILSAGYGLIPADREIVPYEVTFNNMRKVELEEWSKHLEINDSVSRLAVKYDLAFFLLGENYLQALQLPLKSDINGRLIFLASEAAEKIIPDLEPYAYIKVGLEEARLFRYGL